MASLAQCRPRAVAIVLGTIAATLLAQSAITPSRALAANEDPAIPSSLTLDDALKLFHTRGYDLLIADAAVFDAQADVAAAGAVPNPDLTLAPGRVIDPTYSTANCGACSKNVYNVALSDNGALFDTLSNKRGLRLAVARKALEVAKLGRADTQRILDLQLKQSYAAYAAATIGVGYARETQAAASRILDANRARFPGKIDEGALARIETAKIAADRQLELAVAGAKIARVGLAFLLGVRGKVPDFAVAGEPLKFVVPTALKSATEDTLVELARKHRPDFLASKVEKERAEDSLVLAKRLRFPGIELGVQYTQIGSGQTAVQPPTFVVGLTFTLPAFYQYQGEIKKAESAIYRGSVTIKKVDAMIAADVATAYESWKAQKTIVERMETELLARARKARDITEAQFNDGKALLTDLLDAQRVLVATYQDYVSDLATYWNAVFALEYAVGTELRK